jgi:hypothetical protein
VECFIDMLAGVDHANDIDPIRIERKKPSRDRRQGDGDREPGVNVSARSVESPPSSENSHRSFDKSISGTGLRLQYIDGLGRKRSWSPTEHEHCHPVAVRRRQGAGRPMWRAIRIDPLKPLSLARRVAIAAMVA